MSARPERLFLVAELRELEEKAARGLAPGTLMARAGHAAADWALRLASDRGGRIAVLAGPGNNGGDALVMARLLRERGAVLDVARCGAGTALHGEAAAALADWRAAGGTCASDWQPDGATGLVVDGLFGIGLNRALPPLAVAWVEAATRWRAQSGGAILALDIPSGLNADTGQAAGAVLAASDTLTFLGRKPGLYTGLGPDVAGRIHLDTLQVEAAVETRGFLSDRTACAAQLVPRVYASHKGSYGSVAVVAGSPGTQGAGLLASRSALYAGAGRIYLHAPGSGAAGVDGLHPEIMVRASLEGIEGPVGVVGPGLGQTEAARRALVAILGAARSLVIDADALNLAARSAVLLRRIARLDKPKVLTPHPLEAARLLRRDVAAVERDRIASACELAARLSAVVVLKGAGSIIADPAGRYAVNPTGNPGLATGGTGDVLAGLIGALLAQGLDAWHAALAGVWMHGQAADDLVAAGIGPAGLTASELLPAIRAVHNRLAAGRH